jgi:hypothetical protein
MFREGSQCGCRCTAVQLIQNTKNTATDRAVNKTIPFCGSHMFGICNVYKGEEEEGQVRYIPSE